MNVALAEEIMALILMEPEKLDMTLFVARLDRVVALGDDDYYDAGDLRDDCGTTACIAGWAALLTLPASARIRSGQIIEICGREQHIDVYAAAKLGISRELSQLLFYDVDDSEAVPALKFLIGNPDADAKDFRKFLQAGRDPVC